MKRILFTLLWAALSAVMVSAAQETIDQAQLTVAIAVKNGKLISVRDPERTLLIPSSRFKRQLRRPEAEIRKALLDSLDAAFALMPPLYRYSLSDSERKLDDAGKLGDGLTDALRNFTGDWTTFKGMFGEWAAAGSNRLPLFQVFSGGGVLKYLNSIDSSSALIFNSAVSRPPVPWNLQNGTILFKVADPIGDLSDSREYDISIGGAGTVSTAARPQEIIRLLKPLEGTLWSSNEIRPLIEDFYTSRGLQPAVNISGAKANPKRIQILESPRIVRIILGNSIPAESLDEALYYVLPDERFRFFLRRRPIEDHPAQPGLPAFKAVDLRSLCDSSGAASGLPCAAPYLNSFRLQTQQMQLNQLGFSAAVRPNFASTGCQTTDLSCVDMFIDKAAASAAKNAAAGGETKPAAAAANSEGVIDPNIPSASGRNSFVPSLPNLHSGSQSASPAGEPPAGDQPVDTNSKSKTKNHYIGGGIEYKPGQGVRTFGIFQQSKLGLLSGQDSISVKAGGQDEGLGSLNYYADFVLFNWLHRRLSIQLTGSSDFESSRVFSGVMAGERRTGGFARAELELFRDLKGSLLRFYLQGRRDTVELTQKNSPDHKQNLSTLDAGSLYLFENGDARYPRQLRVEPRVRFGLGLGSRELRFTTLALSANYHQQLPRLLETDITGHFQLASANTPLFELPSLGGADSLRGFRRDDAIGRKLWSLQSELWIPPPNAGAPESKLNRFLKRQFRIAAFVDAGGIGETTGSQAGTRLGPGVGARLRLFPVIMKLDWAYGIGDAARGRGHGRFYFSAGTNLPF